MFNLLPNSLRKEIISEYRFRLLIVIMLFVILIQISFLVFLFPSWLSSYYKEKDFSLRSEEANKSLSTLDISSTTSYIKRLNSTLAVIDESLSYPNFNSIIDDVLKRKPTGVRIDGIYYTVNSKNTAGLAISGIGDKRDTLVSFSESLKDISYFKKVDLPISNLAKDKNIVFTINVDIEK